MNITPENLIGIGLKELEYSSNPHCFVLRWPKTGRNFMGISDGSMFMVGWVDPKYRHYRGVTRPAWGLYVVIGFRREQESPQSSITSAIEALLEHAHEAGRDAKLKEIQRVLH